MQSTSLCRQPGRPSCPHGQQQRIAHSSSVRRGTCRLLPTRAAAEDAALQAPDSTAKCPFSAITSAMNLQQPQQRPAVNASGSGLQPIPGPPPMSLEALGDVMKIFTGGLHVAMLAFSEKYGPICKFANPASLNGATSWVFLNSPDNIQHVCATNVRNYSRRYLPDIYKYVTHEKGILGSQDEYNSRHRRLCQPAFRNKQQLQAFADVMVARSQRLADIWSSQLASAGPFLTDVATQTQRLTLDIVGLTAFSHDFQQTERVARDLDGAANDTTQSTDRLLWAVNTFGTVLAEVFITPMPLLRLLHSLGFPQLRQLDTAVSTMREAMLGVIQKRREELAAGLPGKPDLLGVLLAAVDEAGQALTDEELWEDVHDVMGAGHETTATTTAAALYCISVHPEVEARVVAELEQVLQGQPPRYEHLEQLPYLQACVKEVLRLYPAIPVFPREAAANDVLPTGHPVAAGDVVFMSSYSLGRCPRIWEDPLTFNPDRFLPEQEEQHHRFQFLPFGAGPRMCLGSSFAMMSVTLVMASLLQKFKFEAVHPSSQLLPVSYDITMNFNVTQGLRMQLQPRQQQQQQEPGSQPQEAAAAVAAV